MDNNCNKKVSSDLYYVVDYNECGNRTDNCSAQATCYNTNGSFYCECNSGFDGSGYYCEGISGKQRRS